MDKLEVILEIQKLKPKAIKLGFDFPSGYEPNQWTAPMNELEEFLKELQDFMAENQ